MSYGPNFFSLIETGYIDKIFKGAKPADLPVAQPTKFELVVNLTSSWAMRRSISPITFFENGPRCMYSAISITMCRSRLDRRADPVLAG
jgi:hypothetical protein